MHSMHERTDFELVQLWRLPVYIDY
eukprot:SAG22_NODE_13190_length_415_cov_0.946203_1_plen_24_part_10